MKPKELIRLINKSSFDNYPDDTIGDLIRDFFVDPEYEVIEDEDGNTYVNIIGEVQYDEENCEMLIQFAIVDDYELFTINAIEINEEPCNEDEIVDVLEVIYNSYYNDEDDDEDEDENEDEE